MQTMRYVRYIVCLLILLKITISCGITPLATYSTEYIRISQFAVSKTNLTSGDSFEVSWKVSYNNANEFYRAYLYVSPTRNIQEIDYYRYEIGYEFCGNSTIYACNENGKFICIYKGRNIVNELEFECDGSREVIPITDNKGYMILRVCIYDSDMNLICDSEVVSITFN